MFAAWIHWSTTFFIHPSIGIVRVWLAFPFQIDNGPVFFTLLNVSEI